MSLAKRIGVGIAALGKGMAAPLGRRNRPKALAHASDLLTPVVDLDTPYGPLKMRCPNAETTRVSRHGLAWEPETIDWIDAHVGQDDCIWDIGAHIGLFSIYAGAKQRRGKGTVLAFEPSATNYAALNGNIFINGLSDRVTAYCLALSERSEAGKFHMTDPWAGSVLNAFGTPENFRGTFTPTFSQGAISFSIDDAVGTLGLTQPDHIKLDVDSIEVAILSGATTTLTRVKTLLIEIENERGTAWIEQVETLLGRAGLKKTASPRGTVHNVLYTRA